MTDEEIKIVDEYITVLIRRGLTLANETNECYIGHWWTPDNVGLRIPGTLSIPLDGVPNLDLHGVFRDSADIPRLNGEERIFGDTGAGPITLENVSQRSFSFSGVNRESSSQMKAKYAFIGGHFKASADIVFRQATIDYSCLADWLKQNGVDFDVDKVHNWVIKCKTPPSIETNVRTMRLIFKINPTVSIGGNFHKIAQIDQESSLIIDPTQPMPVGDLFDVVRHIRNFLCFATYAPAHTLKITGTLVLPRTHDKSRKAAKTVDIFGQGINGSIARQGLSPFEILFDYPDISDKFDTYLNAWFEKWDILKPTIDLFSITLNERNLDNETRFLYLAQALEAYHRRMKDSFIMQPDKFDELVDSMIKGLSKKEASWIKKKLDYCNKPSFRKRISEIIKNMPEPLHPIAGNITSFDYRVASTRHYLTHYDAAGQKPAATGEALGDLANRLSLILAVVLMQEIGMSSENIVKQITMNGKFSRELS